MGEDSRERRISVRGRLPLTPIAFVQSGAHAYGDGLLPDVKVGGAVKLAFGEKIARRHLDVRFFWRLMEVLPVAESGAGELREAEADVATMRAHLDDITDSGRGEVAELLRPFYLDYLKRHGVEASEADAT